jgi:hypothetical protein
VSFNHAYNEDLVMQFFATVYFENDTARTLVWMSGTHQCHASMAKFAEILPYQFFEEENEEFGRVRDIGMRSKDEIAFAYREDRAFTTGSIKDLVPVYDTLHHILRYTLTPKAGDSHNVRSSMLDVFVYCQQKKKLDVLDFMFYELYNCVHENKSLIYAPFVQALIESVCPARYISQYKTVIPKRNRNWTPAAPAPYVPPKRRHNPRPEDRAIYTPGCSSTAWILRGKGKAPAVVEASFSREEKKSLFKTMKNMFMMCQSMQRRQLRDINKDKLMRHQKKVERDAAGEVVQARSEDHDSEATQRSFPLANWRFNDDADDASSAPPLV